MDFDLTPEQRDIRELARRFSDREIAPRAAQADIDKSFPMEVHQRAQQLGLLAINLPEDVGGAGLGTMELVLVTESFCRGCLGIGTTLCINALATEPISIAGTAEQRRMYLGKAANGALASFAMTEPAAGSDVAGIRMRADRTAGGYVLNGCKIWISNANLAEYRVPVNADVPSLEAILVEEGDPHVNALGIKGVGEIGITGTAGAVANAVWHATGIRPRRFPIRIEELTQG